MTSVDLARQMALTAELVREHLWKHPEIELLRAAGVQVMFGYTDTAVWLQVGGRTASRVAWIRWWEPERSSAEDHAARVAHRLVSDWKDGPGSTSTSEQ